MLMMDRRRLLGSIAGAALASAAPGRAATRGAAPLKLEALQSLIDGLVAAGRVPGAVVAVVEPGAFRPQFLSVGRTAFDGGQAVTPDTLWRIYSMSKPITAMAVMQRIAARDLAIDQPVADILPELARPRVLIDPKAGLESMPAPAGPTIRQLLTHTAGYTYAINGDGPLEREYRRLGIQPGSVNGFLRPGDGPLPDLNGMVAALAGLPLWQAPGAGWRYSISLDVAGALLERLAGETLDRVLERQLFGPLGMASTGFWARDAGRLASNYLWIGADGKPLDTPVPLAPIEKDGFTARPRLLSGGGGLVSSARDYARFVQMLLNEGQFNGRTIMPTGTARQALSNMMPLGQLYEGRNGFGAGGRLTLFDTRSGGEGAPAMLYGWGGAAGTLMVVDRVRQLGVVVMLQYMPQQRFPLEKDLARSLNRAADGR